MIIDARFEPNQRTQLDFYNDSSLHNMEDMSLYLNILSWFQVNQSLLILLNAAGLAEE